jgi:hypothetical protein
MTDRICSALRIRSKETLYLAVLMLAAAYLLVQGAGKDCFWDDEAATAILAKNIVKTGRMTGWDGRNLLSYRNGTVLFDNYISREPPLQCYYTALWFKLFGSSTLAGRIPFILCGLLSLVVLWLVLEQALGPPFAAVRWYAFALVAFSYSFFLSSRQCRYYSLSLLFMLLGYYFYLRLLKQPRVAYFAGCFVSLIILFFSHFLIGAAFILSLFAVHVMVHRRGFTVRNWITAGVCTAAGALIILPYTLGLKLWVREDIGAPSVFVKPLHIFWNFRELDLVNYLPFIPGIFLAVFLVRYRTKDIVPRVVYEWLLFIVAMTVLIALFSAQEITWQGVSGGLADVRYLFFVLPFCAGCMGVFLWFLHRGFGALFAVAVLFVMLSSTAFTFNLGNQPMRWPLPGYIYESHTDYSTPYDTTLAYLREHAAQDEVVYTLPEHALNVFHFYLGDRLRMGSTLQKDSRLPTEKLRQAGYPVYRDDYFPDWILVFGMNPDRDNAIRYFSRGPYVYTLQNVIQTLSADRTRPELPWHSFMKPPALPPQSASAIFIFRRAPKPPEQQPVPDSGPETR